MLKLFYIISGLLLAYVGLRIHESLWSYVVLSAGVGCFLVGIAYWRSWSGVLGKRRNGRLMFSSYFLFWPYHLMNWLTYALFRWFVREDPFNEVAPGLFLGARLMPSDRALFKTLENLSVLDLTAEFPEVKFLGTQPGYACLPVLDRTALSPQELQMAVEFIEKRLQKGFVFVHCALGHGRSAMPVAAWMLKKGMVKSSAEAITALRQKRPGVRPSASQMQALNHFANKL